MKQLMYPEISISAKELNKFLLSYNQGRMPQERLGQAFVNRFLEDGSYSELFYADDATALKLITSRHVQRWKKMSNTNEQGSFPVSPPCKRTNQKETQGDWHETNDLQVPAEHNRQEATIEQQPIE